MDIDGKSVSIEIDTGAAISIMSQESYKELWTDRDLKESKAKLRTYSGRVSESLGKGRDQSVTFQQQCQATTCHCTR